VKLNETLQGLENSFRSEAESLKQAPDSAVVEQLRVKWLGKKGAVTVLYEQLRNFDKAERPEAGKLINTLRDFVEGQLNSLKEAGERALIAKKIQEHRVDVTLPSSQSTAPGSLHPVTLMRTLLIKEFRRLGFAVWEGPEVDLDFYNFSALNFPDDHPARDMQDTFFVKDRNAILRTHTSNIQVHAMLQEPPPLRIVSLGRVYRCDNDATHAPMFHQVEGVLVDKNISMGHLKGIIDSFIKAIYGSEMKTRFRPSFFPFVEPGAEFDLLCTCKGVGCRLCKNTGWLEAGGCGMIHPNVFENVNYDSEVYTGFAFGFGIDRMAMIAFGVEDLRIMFEGDNQFQSQFPIYWK
jgi:phenylalanyl-tRNA synthetase alpha chain